jgi:hypothetical protein
MTTAAGPRALLLLGQAGERQFHNQPEHWSQLAALLRTVALAGRTISDDLAVLTPARLAEVDVILNFSTDLTASAAQIEALLAAVAGGVGYIGLHAATATFRDSTAYHGLIGSWFARHPPIKQFLVEPVRPEHPVMRGLTAFTIEDERYELRDQLPDCEVLAEAEGFPMVYVRQYGRGRVCYIALGHDGRALGQPDYQRLVGQAIAWVTGRSDTTG